MISLLAGNYAAGSPASLLFARLNQLSSPDIAALRQWSFFAEVGWRQWDMSL
jgi:hypothetical protein